MNIIVTGGTGFIGKPLVQRLVSQGHAVTVLTRDPARAARVLPARCDTRPWEPRGPVNLDPLRWADAVIHLAGAGVADRRWTEARRGAIRESRVGSSRAIVRAMEMLPAAERPRVFLSASAIGFYGDRGDLELNECAAAGEGYLAAVCQAWEQEVLRANKLDVRTVAVRVGIVLGRGGGALEKMLRPFRLGVGGRLGSGRQWMSWIHVEDLVSMFVFLLGCEDARGAVNGVGPNPVTNSDFTKALAGALQRPALCSVPAVALRVLLGEMSSILLASQRVVPAMAERLGFSFCFPTLASALDNLCSDASREIIREFWLARPPEQVFRFFSNPRNLERITPDFLRFRVLGTNTAEVGEGTLIDYRLALHGLPLRWQSRIESWQPNRSFVDVQVRGPYRVWHHTHEFEPADGGTIVRDRVRYALPFGPLGELFGGPFVAKDLDAIFDFRRERITEALA